MQREKKDKHFIKQPTYPGGLKKMRTFITQQLRYPKDDLAAKTEGTVALKYTIDHKGKVVEVKVISSLSKGCDEEAVRLVKLLKFDVPKQPGSSKVLFHKNVQIHFRLPKAKPAPSTQLQYQLTPAKPIKEEEAAPKTGGGYSYTISF